MATTDPQQLRVELKEWEHQFLEAHGRKPGRADIKDNREMAAKYKLYDKVTRKPSSKTRKDPVASSPSSGKRKRDSGIGFAVEDLQATPTKVSRTSSSLREASSDPYDPPLNDFFSPAASQRTFIGPTPQKNGKVLGLFDLLSPESAQKTTPRKEASLRRLASQTPSKSRNADLLSSATPTRSRMGPPAATPSKRTVSGPGILTPSRSRLNEQQKQADSMTKSMLTTPSMQRAKVLDLDLDKTPDFLKRRHSPAYRPSTSTLAGNSGTDAGAGTAEGMMNIAWSPVAVRQLRKPIGRSFSQIIDDNRRAEEERIQRDLEILREFERDSDDDSTGPTKRTLERSQSAIQPLGTDIIIPRQMANTGDEFPLGPDGDRQVDRSDDEDGAASQNTGAEAGPRRWKKKKGPKRQTKKFNIRPTQVKWQPEPEWKAGMDNGDDEFVPETQVAGRALADGDADDLESDYEDASKTSTKKAPSKASSKKESVKETGAKKGRKVSAMAHANYRSLKIKNKNSKAKKGGRFGRRRG